MTTKTEIKLPSLPQPRIMPQDAKTKIAYGYGIDDMDAYARAAVEADRQGRVPSDEEIERLAYYFDNSGALEGEPIDFDRIGFARALLGRYASGQPNPRIRGNCAAPAAQEPEDWRSEVDTIANNIGEALSGATEQGIVDAITPYVDQLFALIRQPAAPVAQEPTESILIDGAAYTIPVPVAAELLRLHIELKQGVPVAQDPVAVPTWDDLQALAAKGE